MSTSTIFPTQSKPLIIAAKSSRNQLSAKKVWVNVLHQTPMHRVEEIWCATCQFSEAHSEEEINSRWTEPKRISPKDTTLTVIQYNSTINVYTTACILKICDIRNLQNLRQPKSEYVSFALNPAHHFSAIQLKSIWQQLRSWMTEEERQQFLTMWPDVENSLPTTQPVENPYPCTVKEALAAISNKQTVQIEQPRIPATPLFIEQPTSAAILIPKLQATNFRAINRKQQIADASVILKVTPQGKTNRRREVFYATPVNSEDSFPISPLKSNVAILYADVNPSSPTFNQPMIKSICFATSTPEQIAKFYKEHKDNLSAEQLLQFSTPSHTLPKINPTFESQIMKCKFCQTDFEQQHANALYCSPKCRIDYNAGKTHGSAVQAPRAAVGAVTREEFASLQAQLAQVIGLLSK